MALKNEREFDSAQIKRPLMSDSMRYLPVRCRLIWIVDDEDNTPILMVLDFAALTGSMDRPVSSSLRTSGTPQ